MMNVSVKWEIKQKEKTGFKHTLGNSVGRGHVSQGHIYYDWLTLPLYTPTYAFIACFTGAAHSASSLLLCSTPTLDCQAPPPISQEYYSLPVISCSEANDWSPTFHFLLPFPSVSYMIRERIAKSMHLQGKAGHARVTAL